MLQHSRFYFVAAMKTLHTFCPSENIFVIFFYSMIVARLEISEALFVKIAVTFIIFLQIASTFTTFASTSLFKSRPNNFFQEFQWGFGIDIPINHS